MAFIEFLSNEKVIVVLISSVTTIVVFFLTLFTKRWAETRILSSKLQTEHKFEERKKIKSVLAKYKIHLITACDDLNHRYWNFANKHQEGWLNLNGDYHDEQNYYFHSFVYRFLSVFAWTQKIQKEMVYLDTTIANKEDIELIKFTHVFSRFFCDLTFIEGINADGNQAIDHFYRNHFEEFAQTLITNDGIKSFTQYNSEISSNADKLKELYEYFDGLTPNEDRKRWDRMHFLHLTLIAFLNNYGYDFQKTNDSKIVDVLRKPKRSEFLSCYLKLLSDYQLDNNSQIKNIKNLICKNNFISSSSDIQNSAQCVAP